MLARTMSTSKELTRAEWAVIKAVWEGEPCAATQIQEKLFSRTKWTYSTVRTLMDRMVAKGFLTAEKVRNATLYRAALKREEAQRGEVLYALKQAFNGALTPMVQCLIETGKVSASDLDELEELIKAKKRATRK
jgi:predicted transcriptional regulator